MVNKFSSTASGFTADKLKKLVKLAKDTDIELKTNSMDNNVLLELFVMKTAL